MDVVRERDERELDGFVLIDFEEDSSFLVYLVAPDWVFWEPGTSSKLFDIQRGRRECVLDFLCD